MTKSITKKDIISLSLTINRPHLAQPPHAIGHVGHQWLHEPDHIKERGYQDNDPVLCREPDPGVVALPERDSLPVLAVLHAYFDNALLEVAVRSVIVAPDRDQVAQHGRQDEQGQEEGVPNVVQEDEADPAAGLPCDFEVDDDGKDEDGEADPDQFPKDLRLRHGLMCVCDLVLWY